MKFGSLFSGAGGFDIGLERAGLATAFQCEIDPQASKVLQRHWPDSPKHTDIRLMKKKHAPRVDVLAGGFPCQDLSVAGKREGLKGERSGLFYELLRVATLCKPEYILFENVPGLLSSDNGRDFGRVLRGLADIGYFGAWRVLDARFFGVPQRRRRVFGLFARGRFGADRCAEILALTEGVCRDSAAGQEAGQDVAFTLTSSVGRNSGGTRVGNAWNTNYVADTLRASAGRRNGQPSKGWEEGHLVETTFTELGEGHATYRPTSLAGSLRTNAGGGGLSVNLVARCLTSRNQRIDAETETLIAFSAKDHGADAGELSPTLRAGGFRDSHQNGGVMPAVAFSNRGIETGDSTETLRAASHGALPPLATPHAFVPDVAQPIRSNVFNNSDPGMEATMHVAPAGGVRRLTPRECERLMSWPDDWTRWDDAGDEFADGPRYRMCGNGVVSNCAEWIGRRLVADVK